MPRFPIASIFLLAPLLSLWVELAHGQDPAALRVRLEAGPGPYYLGQGIELAVGVVGRDQRPRIELPRLSHAEIWTTGTSFKPIHATGIGPLRSGENLYVTRLRIVARRAGPLEVLPILASIDGQTSRSRSLHLMIETVPLEGRPAEFLGGVGEFSVQAGVTPATVHVGQDLIFRIQITGPAAWGTTSRPDLSRFARIPLAARIEPLPDETASEPPSRTFVYRIRPTRAGSAILPPVAIAAFDPRSLWYITKVTQGVPIKAVAVPAFDPKTIDYSAPDVARNRRIAMAWGSAASVLIIVLGASGLALVFRRRRFARQTGPRAAQRFAKQMARELSITPVEGSPGESERNVAEKIIDGLVTYARIGIGRPPGALTPSEAWSLVHELTRSEHLANQSAALVARCDHALFSERSTGHNAEQRLGEALKLYTALGRAPVSSLSDHPAQRAASS